MNIEIDTTDWATFDRAAINRAYEQLMVARGDLFNAHQTTIQAEHSYEDARASLLVMTPPKELGLNEEQRQAKLAELLAANTKAMREAQAKERHERLHYELALDDVRRLDALLQLLAANAVHTVAAPAPNDGQLSLVEF